MDCKHAGQDAQLWLDGALDADRSERLERHAAQCPDCADFLTSLKKVSQLVSELPLASPSAGFSIGVISRLRERGVITSAPKRRRVVTQSIAAVFVLAVAGALFPAAVEPLLSVLGKGAVLLKDGLMAVARNEVLASVAQTIRKAGTIFDVGASLLSSASQVFMLPALLALLIISLCFYGFFRVANGRGSQNASFMC